MAKSEEKVRPLDEEAEEPTRSSLGIFEEETTSVPPKPKHVYEGKRTVDTGYCSDHYCTGHSSSTIHCSCGWHQDSYTDYRDSWKDDIAWLHHVVSALQKDD